MGSPSRLQLSEWSLLRHTRAAFPRLPLALQTQDSTTAVYAGGPSAIMSPASTFVVNDQSGGGSAMTPAGMGGTFVVGSGGSLGDDGDYMAALQAASQGKSG